MKRVKVLFVLATIFLSLLIMEFVRAEKLTKELETTKKQLLAAQGQLGDNYQKLEEYKEQLSNIAGSVQDLETSTNNQQVTDQAEDIESDITTLSNEMDNY